MKFNEESIALRGKILAWFLMPLFVRITIYFLHKLFNPFEPWFFHLQNAGDSTLPPHRQVRPDTVLTSFQLENSVIDLEKSFLELAGFPLSP